MLGADLAGAGSSWPVAQLRPSSAAPTTAAPAQLHFDLTEWPLHLTEPTCTRTFTNSLFSLTSWFDCFSKLDACTRRQRAAAALQ
jgi:hypothetical protein